MLAYLSFCTPALLVEKSFAAIGLYRKATARRWNLPLSGNGTFALTGDLCRMRSGLPCDGRTALKQRNSQSAPAQE